MMSAESICVSLVYVSVFVNVLYQRFFHIFDILHLFNLAQMKNEFLFFIFKESSQNNKSQLAKT